MSGEFTVGSGKPTEFTATLSGTGLKADVTLTVSGVKLSDLTGWAIPGLESLSVEDVTAANTYKSGKAKVKGLEAEVYVFKAAGQAKSNVFLRFPAALRLSHFVSALKNTPVDELSLSQAAFLYVAKENAPVAAAAIPAPMAKELDKQVLDLAPGLGLFAKADPTGELQAMLRQAGLAVNNLPLTGSLDPELLKQGVGALSSTFINAVDLVVPLGDLKFAGKPYWIAFKDNKLAVKGAEGKLNAAITTDVELTLGSKVSFPDVSITRDPKVGLVMASKPSKPSASNLFSLPASGAQLTSLAFGGVSIPAGTSYTLAGSFSVGTGLPTDFTAALSGTGTKADVTLTVSGVKLSDLTGWPVPGLEDLAVEDVTAAETYKTGKVTVKGMGAEVYVFKAAGQAKSNVFLRFPGALKLSSLASAVKDTPVDAMSLAQAAFLYVAKENAPVAAAAIPGPLADQLGKKALDLAPGLGLFAKADPTGELAELLKQAGLASSGLALSGSLDPELLKQGVGALSSTFINAVDLVIPFGELKFTGKPNWISFKDAKLSIKGRGSRFAAAITTDVELTLGSKVSFPDVSITRDPKVGLVMASKPSKPSVSNLFSLPAAGAELTSLGLSGVGGSYTLSGSFAVGTGKPTEFTATLSGTGAKADVTLTVSGVKLSDLTGWAVPGLEDLAVEDVTAAETYKTGKVTVKGMGAEVYVFKAAGQAKANLFLRFPGALKLSSLASAVKDTPVDAMSLAQAAFLYVAKENAPVMAAAIPAAMAKELNKQVLDLNPGLGLFAKADPTGELAELLKQAGLASSGLPLSGSLDPELLKQGAGALSTAFINAVDLVVPFGDIKLPQQPSWIAFKNSKLAVKGVDGKLNAAITTDVELTLGSKVSFPDVSITRDPKVGLVLASKPSKPSVSNLFSLPAAGAELTSLGLSGVGGGYTLSGSFAVGTGKPTEFTATLSGTGAKADVKIAVSSIRLTDLTGWAVPGLEDLAVEDVILADTYKSGTVKVKGLAAEVYVFKTAAQKNSDLFLRFPGEMTMSSVVAAAKNTPLDQLLLKTLGLLFVPKENLRAAVTPPPAVAAALGQASLVPTAGLAMTAFAAPQGNLKALVDSLGMPSRDLPLAGKFDPSLLSEGASSLTNAFLASLDLQAPLGDMTVPGVKGVSLAKANFYLKGQCASAQSCSGVTAGVYGSLSVSAGGKSFVIPSTATVASDGQVSLAGTSPQAWTDILGTPIDIANISAAATFGKEGSFSLTGATELFNKKKASFKAALSAGGAQAEGAFAISAPAGTTFSLADVTGWTVPGLEALNVSGLEIGDGVLSTRVNIKGVAADIVLFKPANKSKWNAAVLFPAELRLSSLAPALASTPLDQVSLGNPGFIIVPTENQGSAVGLPKQVSDLVGKQTMNLGPGLNLTASASFEGDLKSLFESVNIKATGLPLSGKIDPALLKGDVGGAGSQLWNAFVSGLDISAPIGDIALPGTDGATMRSAKVLLKGENNAIVAGIAGDVAFSAGSVNLVIPSRMTVTTRNNAKVVTLAGTSTQGWNKMLGLDWLNVRNLSVSAVIGGGGALSVGGQADLGSGANAVKNLAVTVFMSKNQSGGSDMGVSLMGADIPLGAIPGLDKLPDMAGLKLSDVTVSMNSLAATLKTTASSLQFLNGLSAVFFQSGGQWTLVARKPNARISDVVPVADAAKAAVDKFTIKEMAMAVSQAGVTTAFTSLPKAAQDMLQTVYGAEARRVQLGSGLSMLAAIDPKSLGGMFSLVGASAQNMVLEGGIGGMFGGNPSFNLGVAVPRLEIPGALSFLSLPKEMESSFRIKYKYIGPKNYELQTGVWLSATVPVKTRNKDVDFTTDVSFALDTKGGLEVGVQGLAASAWKNAMGIDGLTLEPGTRMQVSLNSAAQLIVTFVGKSKIGAKSVDLVGSMGVTAGIVSGGAFRGKVSELGLEDIMALTNAMVGAAGGKPLEADFPTAKVKNVDVVFASPGTDVPELEISNGGTRLKGDLWFLMNDRSLGKVLAEISGNGLIMKGSLADINVGVFQMKGNMLDAKALIMPPTPPYFKIRGNAELFGKSGLMEASATATGVEYAMGIDLGALMNFDYRVKAGAKSVSAADLAKSDLALSASLKSDLSKWLSGEGRKPVEDLFKGMQKGFDAATAGLRAAQAEVDKLDKDIENAKAAARKNQKGMNKALENAQKQVNTLTATIDSLAKDIKNAKEHLHTCDYKKKICIWRHLITGKCLEKMKVMDLKRNLKCAGDNISYGAVVAAKETAKAAVVASRETAKATLKAIQQGSKNVDAADVDPVVLGLLAARETATFVLNQSKAAVDGMDRAAEVINSGLDFLAKPGSFAIKKTLIEGSARKSVQGKPVVMGVKLEVMNNDIEQGLAISFTDPLFTMDQLTVLPLMITSKALDADPKTPALVRKAVAQAYEAKADAVRAKLKAALKENGLDEDDEEEADD
ncbi:MAG: hypothetical protein WC943_12810 [Elusimicrobiota bacterium]